ncbi:PTS fructose transporter subunit IIC [Salana multivorans]
MKFVAVSSCPTGIAHTYMAAEALEQAGKAAGHEVVVETQGSIGTEEIPLEVIQAADGVIFAADLEVKGKERFAGKPTINVGVKRAVHEPTKVLEEAIAAVESGVATPAAGPTPAAAAAPAAGPGGASALSKVRQQLMTGVSYMIPFVAAGGILIAVSFMLAQVAWGGAEGAVEVTAVDPVAVFSDFDFGSLQAWAVALNATGGLAFGFLVPVLSGYIAFAIADRPGIVPGFVGGAASVLVGAGFLGGLLTGFAAGYLALWISRWKVHKGVRGIMPVVVIPLLSSLAIGILMLVLIGRPIAALMEGLSTWLEGLSGGSIVFLGLLLGAMMGSDLGGPINKVAYTFAVTGLATQGLPSDAAQYKIMAAVMGAGMVAPLGMALASTVRKKLFTPIEQENGKASWLLGASFISEGAIPFAAADPWRVIVSSIVGSAATGGLIMAFGSTLVAPHGGIWVIPLIGNPFGFLGAVVIGSCVTAAVIIVLKTLRAKAASSAAAPAAATAA